ncbi:MAG: glutaredoxin family protein [Alcanivorax sp.]|nr:glutaredoxin family protein [Alcanivorax sp.]
MRCAILMLLLWLAGGAQADIYKWTDSHGRVHFGDKPRQQDQAKKVRLKVNTYKSVSYQSLGKPLPGHDNNRRLLMYSTSWCGYCEKARRYFKAHHIPFDDYDIEHNEWARQQYQSMGATGVPVIVMGKRRMNGFNARAFERFYRN